ncbi:MAG: M48 family metalloprotease [Capsulimonadales bacterium]|nr:M48 family metalloprotease [Capsulimonadales bacterium]
MSIFRRRRAFPGILTAIFILLPGSLLPASVFAGDPPQQNDAKKTEKTEKKAKPPGEDPEVKLGQQSHEEMVKSGLKLITDPALVARVTEIGKKIAAIANTTKTEATYGSSELVPYDYKFFIVDDPDVNAFSLPGGYIYINKGLLNYVQSDDELAGVLGHEIIHAAHHHVVRLQKEQNKLNNAMLITTLATLFARVPTADALNVLQGFQLVALQKVNGFGQNAERDADRAGLIVMHKAGYNPVGMLTFMERLSRDQRLRPDIELGIFRTHPPENERADALTAQIKEQNLPINRRAVTKMLRVEVRTVALNKDVQATEVLLDKQIVYRTPSEARAREAADRLNRLLDHNIQLFDVTRKGVSVLVRGEAIFTVGAADTDLPGSPSAEKLAETGYKNLRLALYRQSVETSF